MSDPKHPCPICEREMRLADCTWSDELQAYTFERWECVATPDQHEIARLKAALAAAEKDAALCRGMVDAQEKMIQAALEPLGCGYPFDHHAAEWAADQLTATQDENAKLMAELEEARDMRPDPRNASIQAMDEIQTLCGYYTTPWEYPGQVVRDVRKLVAERDLLRRAVVELREYIEQNECHHENLHRGGTIWTICDDCGKKWADDRGGFVPYQAPRILASTARLVPNKEQK